MCGESTPRLLGLYDEEGGEGGGNSFVKGRVSIAYLKSLYISTPLIISEEMSVEGVVTSTDSRGNFYRTVYIEDDTGGIAVRIAMNDLYKTFLIGHRVSVNCNLLSLGAYGGMHQLGKGIWVDGYEVGDIPANSVASHFRISSGEGSEPLPAKLTIGELTTHMVGSYVEIQDVQFLEPAEQVSPGWCEEGEDTDRILIDREGNTLRVRTRHYADFAAHPLPLGSGFIRGILSYFNGYQLLIVNPIHAIMDDPRF